MRKKGLFFYFFSALWLFGGTVLGQSRVVSGSVSSGQDGSALSGVSVLIDGGATGATTNEDGNFTIRLPAGAKALVFRFIGFESKTVAVGTESRLAVVLTPDVSMLNEVVVTGYGDVQRQKYAGSTVSVSVKDLSKQPMGSFDQALQGLAAGVSVQASSGQPGSAAQVRIRGNGSINGSNDPLYILDGVEISAADFSSMNQGDFESVEVLKDAVSTAIYGSRGANGVIVIRTKKGQAGQFRLDYQGNYGFSKMPTDRVKVMNSAEKIAYEMQVGNPYDWTDAQADSLSQVNFNWKDALFQTGKNQEHTLNASGGNDKSTYFGSLSYFNQEGVVQTTGLKRYTARVNLDNKIGNWRFGLNLQGGFSKISDTPEGNASVSSPLNAMRWSNPYETATNPETGAYQETGGEGSGQLTSGQPNGAMILFLNYNWQNQIKGLGTSYIEYHLPFLDGLYARTNWGVDYTQNENAVFRDPRTSGAQSTKGSLMRDFDRNFRYTGTTSLNYSGSFEKHELSAGLFFEVVKNDASGFGFTGYGFTNGFTNETGITAGSASNTNYIPSVTGQGSKNGILSYFTTINYGYNEKYYINLVGRRDGSSRFGKNNRFANFGSVGVSWSVMKEPFMKNVGAVDDLRLRASFGTNGNTGVADYPIPIYERNSYSGISAWAPGEPGNLDLGWETNRTLDVGVDFALLGNRLSGTIEYYNRETVNLFYDLPVDPSTSGFTTILGNFGKMRNAGFEFSLNTDVVKNEKLTWSVGGNISYNKNQVISLPQDSVVSGNTILAEGHPYNSLFLVDYAGVNPENGNAQYRRPGGEITETFNVNDKQIWGTTEAPWVGGITTAFAYKGFDLSAQLNFFLGRVMFNNAYVDLVNPQYYWDNVSVDMLTAWKQPGDKTNVPRITASDGNAFQDQVNRFLEDADFWRLRSVTVGYTLPGHVLEKAGFRTVRIFMQGQNWWTSTKFRGFDPETTGNTLTGAQYPALVQTMFGLTLGF